MRNTAIVFVIVLVTVLLIGIAVPVTAQDSHSLTVDGTVYSPTKVVGNDADPTVHYETPDTSPTVAFSERHDWVGNGSEHLPCEGGIHWIDNKNVLTISNCLETESSSTTTLPPTTTSQPSTTTIPEQTTTSTTPSSSTTLPDSSTTTSPSSSSSSSLPVTGVPSSTMLGVSMGLLSLGGLAILTARMRTNDI